MAQRALEYERKASSRSYFGDAGTYRCIAADPPWSFLTYSAKGMGRSPSYRVMTLTDIESMPVSEIAEKDSVLLLWATNPTLPQALQVMAAWGFQFKTVAFCWAKTTSKSTPDNVRYHFGLGYWTRANIELCLLGTKGSPKRIDRSVRQLIVSPRREHSRKPDEFYSSAQRLVHGPYIELFSRTNRPGWAAWGDEAGTIQLSLNKELAE